MRQLFEQAAQTGQPALPLPDTPLAVQSPKRAASKKKGKQTT